MVETFLEKWKHQKKVVSLSVDASLFTLYWGFKNISFTLYTYILTKILQNGAKFLQKLTPGFTNHMTNWSNLRQAVESPETLNLMGYIYSKKLCLQLKHYI